MHEVTALLREYDRARAYTDALWKDLTPDEVTWRPHEDSSAIGWHLGHQAHVAHFMVRNLTAAEPSPDPELDGLMDSANPEKFRGALPTVERLATFRDTVAERIHTRMNAIAGGHVGAPDQLTIVARHLLIALINHEYQHDQWIGEVRANDLGHDLPTDPDTDQVTRLDGYLVLNPLA
ncbi:DinB family protein [Streptomyces ferrugineus]|uniref:DinB family protein n=1 Tax=Streptomyces ferrugineus TaxID=1413221 RepID=A0A7M2SF88_9ACTN|nr:DinB family protein [Streptomyces ferrugineus]QOV34997.1 DinB family protein [Streptomyces ferrugineus]